MRLTHPWFEAQFYCDATAAGHRIEHEDGSQVTFAEAQGLFLWCPCGVGVLDKDGQERYPLDLSLNKGRPHGVMVPFANPPCGIALPADHGPVSKDKTTRPRWTVGGTGLHDLTLTPSIDVGEPSCWHGFITNGEVT